MAVLKPIPLLNLDKALFQERIIKQNQLRCLYGIRIQAKLIPICPLLNRLCGLKNIQSALKKCTMIDTRDCLRIRNEWNL